MTGNPGHFYNKKWLCDPGSSWRIPGLEVLDGERQRRTDRPGRSTARSRRVAHVLRVHRPAGVDRDLPGVVGGEDGSNLRAAALAPRPEDGNLRLGRDGDRCTVDRLDTDVLRHHQVQVAAEIRRLTLEGVLACCDQLGDPLTDIDT